MKPLSDKPLGESKLGGYGEGYWNNCRRGTDGPVVCDICGIEHPEDRDISYIVSRFLGREVVEDCCGRILDVVYEESGQEFAEKYLREFAENPTDSRFYTLLCTLKRILPKALEKLDEVTSQVKTAVDQVSAISK